MAEGKRRRWMCSCKAQNKASDQTCESCGEVRPSTALAGEIQARHCPYDGETLRSDGFCARAGGYPMLVSCPFACPICRRPLDWDGGCGGCKGSPTSWDRMTWTFPGDRYELEDEDGKPIGGGRHWTLVQKGPRPIYRPTLSEMQALDEILIGGVTASEAIAARASQR